MHTTRWSQFRWPAAVKVAHGKGRCRWKVGEFHQLKLQFWRISHRRSTYTGLRRTSWKSWGCLQLLRRTPDWGGCSRVFKCRAVSVLMLLLLCSPSFWGQQLGTVWCIGVSWWCWRWQFTRRRIKISALTYVECHQPLDCHFLLHRRTLITNPSPGAEIKTRW